MNVKVGEMVIKNDRTFTVIDVDFLTSQLLCEGKDGLEVFYEEEVIPQRKLLFQTR